MRCLRMRITGNFLYRTALVCSIVWLLVSIRNQRSNQGYVRTSHVPRDKEYHRHSIQTIQDVHHGRPPNEPEVHHFGQQEHLQKDKRDKKGAKEHTTPTTTEMQTTEGDGDEQTTVVGPILTTQHNTKGRGRHRTKQGDDHEQDEDTVKQRTQDIPTDDQPIRYDHKDNAHLFGKDDATVPPERRRKHQAGVIEVMDQVRHASTEDEDAHGVRDSLGDPFDDRHRERGSRRSFEAEHKERHERVPYESFGEDHQEFHERGSHDSLDDAHPHLHDREPHDYVNDFLKVGSHKEHDRDVHDSFDRPHDAYHKHIDDPYEVERDHLGHEIHHKDSGHAAKKGHNMQDLYDGLRGESHTAEESRHHSRHDIDDVYKTQTVKYPMSRKRNEDDEEDLASYRGHDSLEGPVDRHGTRRTETGYDDYGRVAGGERRHEEEPHEEERSRRRHDDTRDRDTYADENRGYERDESSERDAEKHRYKHADHNEETSTLESATVDWYRDMDESEENQFYRHRPGLPLTGVVQDDAAEHPFKDHSIYVCSQKQRQMHLKSTCEKLMDPAREERTNHKKRLKLIAINHKRKLLYCVLPKTGSRAWLRFLNGLSEEEGGREDRSHHMRQGLEYVKNVDLEDLDNQYREYAKMIVVRHPLQRFVSAYYEIIVKNQNFMKHGQLPTFKEFTTWVAEKTVRPQVQMAKYINHCQVCRVDYDYIIKAETVDSDFHALSSDLGSHVPLTHERINRVYNMRHYSDIFKYDNLLKTLLSNNTDILEGLMDVYRTDLQVFGYHWDFEKEQSTCDISGHGKQYKCC